MLETDASETHHTGGVAILLLRATAPANDAPSSPSRTTSTRSSVQVKQQVAAAEQQVAAAAVQASEKGMEALENTTSVLAQVLAVFLASASLAKKRARQGKVVVESACAIPLVGVCAIPLSSHPHP